MIRVFLKNGTQVDVPKAEHAEFVYVDELQVKSSAYGREILATFQHDEVSGFIMLDEPKPKEEK